MFDKLSSITNMFKFFNYSLFLSINYGLKHFIFELSSNFLKLFDVYISLF